MNQAPRLVDVNLFESDPVAQRELEDPSHRKIASAFGAVAGSAEMLDHAELANRYPPRLVERDRSGERIDQIELHPSWYALLEATRGAGVPVMNALGSWEGHAPTHALSITMFSMACQAESGHCCPVSMLEAGLRCLQHAAPQHMRPELLDPSPDGWWMGMGMTEIQGGSDVGANTTVARPAGDGLVSLNGAKWFTSCPMSERILFLARPPEAPPGPAGLGLYLYERERCGLRIVRLKDKLGTWSLPSAEVEFHDTPAVEIARAGEGLKAMLVMVNLTRLHAAAGALACARRALIEAIHWARHRSVFGNLLIHQPLHVAVLADLALEVEVGWVLCMRLARAIDNHEDDLARILTPIVKFHVTKHSIRVAAEALECLGGNGYVETFPMARQYRDVILQSIWEGSGNVIALDVARATSRGGWQALVDAIERVAPGLSSLLPDPPSDPFELRRVVGRAGRVLAQALLPSDGWAAEAWRTSRLDDPDPVLGALPARLASGARDYVSTRLLL